MSRLDTDRRVESALSIFVVAVVIGIVAEMLSRTGQSLVFWLMRTQGWSSGRIATFSVAWSWTSGLNAARSWGLVIGLWRLSRSLVSGRARVLSTASLWTFVAALVSMGVWQLAWPALVQNREPKALGLAFTAASIIGLVLSLVGAALWIAALVNLARSTEERRRSWKGRAFVAGLALVVEAAWNGYGSARTMEWPALAILGGIVVAVVHGAGILAVVLPVRRAWRAGPAHALAGPYRSPSPPESAWRSADELRLAGEGVAEVRRRVVTITTVTLLALPVFVFMAADPTSRGLACGVTIVAAVQLFFAVPLTRGLARYTRAPSELPGRSLGIAALLCSTGAIVTSTKSLLALVATLVGWDFALTALTGEGFGGAAASLLATLFFIVALARAARALGDLEVRRRARIALFAYLVTLGLTILGFLVALRNAARGVDATFQLVVAFAFLAALVCLGIYIWFLTAATRMPGFVAAPDPVDAPPAPKSQ